MILTVSKDARENGQKAAQKVYELLNNALSKKTKVRMLVSTGASQFEYFEALTAMEGIDWSRVEVFHLDEYIGIPYEHKASFRKYLKERFISKVNPGAFYEVDGNDVDHTIQVLSEKFRQAPIDVGVIGIGENAHIAFNDPPADFETQEIYHIVNLDGACRQQQFGEGWFETLDLVPKQAISMTVSAILSCKAIVSVVPHKCKANAVRLTLKSDEITPEIPATALKNHDNWFLYLDENSASLL